ncbi:MAG: efflux RND transporter periplasmic adaptor subunit [Firmicutes bacterium]|nr:efflux RND transporter periplasmic adaptor subunit [Bacillota bacterium]
MRIHRTIGLILAALLSVSAALAGCQNGGTSDNGAVVYADRIADLLGLNGFAGVQNRFAGMVEPQKTMKINPDTSRTVKMVAVVEKQRVKAGDVLFTYDTEDLELQLEQTELEIERIDNQIVQYQNEITALEDEKEKASEENKIEYTLEISNRYSSIKQSEYDRKTKQADIAKINEKMNEDTVYAEMDGFVQKLDNSVLNGNSYDNYGNPKTFITLMADGEYRVKATINEQNMMQIHIGDTVLVRSRVDENMTWNGVIEEIDYENAENGNQNGGMYVGYAEDPYTSSSKYPFYISLSSYDGLILGQHVLIELESESEGLASFALPSAYIVQDGSSAYVWKEKNGKLAKQTVLLGTYYEFEDTYEIVDGLKEDDAIVFPTEDLSEGMKVVVNSGVQDPGMQNPEMQNPVMEEQGGKLP